jgi:signal peptidase II
MNSTFRKWLFLFAVVVAVLAVDQVTKHMVITQLQLGESYRLIPALYPYFQITRTENTGAAFGFLSQAGDLFLLVALIIVVIMLIYYPRLPDNTRLTRLAMGLVIGGALGNAFDRVGHGPVIDFIHYQFPPLHISNVSNLADHAIVIGVLLIVLQSWRSDDLSAQNKPGEETDRQNNA